MGAAAPGLTDPPRRWTDGLAPALAGFLWARVCVAAGFAVAHLLSGRVSLPDGRLHLTEGLLTWDGSFYRVLAVGGYDGSPAEAARFFPLYPAAARLLAPLALGREDVVLVVLANVCALGAAVVLWRLAVEVLGPDGDGNGDAVARRAAWMVAVVPPAFVLAFAYAEGPALLLVSATLLALHRRNWWWAALFGLLAGMLRPVGVLLVVPVAVELWRWWRDRPDDRSGSRTRAVPGAVAALAGPVAGLLGGLWWIGAAVGDAGAPLRIQRQLRAGFRDPVTRLAEGLWDLAHLEWRDVVNVAGALVALWLLVVAVRRRQPLGWLLYSAATVAVALSANNIDSLGRYVLLAVPLVIALAQWADRRWRSALVGALGSLGLVVLTAAALWGRLIP
ncbi:MAG: hypothetical protein ACOYOP_01910 [Microthrixaceae bacterium]